MKLYLLTTLLTLATLGYCQSGYTLTDSLDLGEDRTSHDMVETGTVWLGAYKCGDDTTIRIGNCDSGSSIAFDFMVGTDHDSIMVEYEIPWANGYPMITVDSIADTLRGTLCDTSYFLYFNGMESHTADGFVHIVISDTLPGCTMEAQITYIKIYSKAKIPVDTTSTEDTNSNTTNFIAQSFKSYEIAPNPSNGRFDIQFNDQKSHAITVYDLNGKIILNTNSIDGQINLSDTPKGLYFIKIDQYMDKIVIE